MVEFLMFDLLRTKLGLALLRRPSLEQQLLAELHSQHVFDLQVRQEMLNEAKQERRDALEQQTRLTEGTLDVMTALVRAVEGQQATLQSYLGLFTGAGAPMVRATDDAALASMEAGALKQSVRSLPNTSADPFHWMGSRPDLFEPSQDVLEEIKDVLNV